MAGPIPGVGITAPDMISPANGSKLRADQQPITLTIGNSTTNGVRPLAYVFEVATDQGFGSVVFSKTGVPPGDNGRTSLTLANPLAADLTYYWRAKADDGANSSAFSAVSQFNVFTPATFQAPVLIAPVNGVTTNSWRPRFSFQNAARSGFTEGVFYRVELSDSDSFASALGDNFAEHDGGQTIIDSPVDLPAGRQGFWRVRAFDANSIGPWSATGTFFTPSLPTVPTSPTATGPACQNGLLMNPRAYFFDLIGRKEGQSAGDWYDVLSRTGIGGGPPPGVKAGSSHYGITQQLGAGGPRGRLFLPTEQADDLGYYARPVDVIADGPGGLVWVWNEWNTPPYAPRACP
ncbi:MAG: hypothetical protein AB7Q29_19420 [Vicinamibacterales bacterium]